MLLYKNTHLYYGFIQYCRSIESDIPGDHKVDLSNGFSSGTTEYPVHHITPKWMFKDRETGEYEYADELMNHPDNCVQLSYANHILAHQYLAACFPQEDNLVAEWLMLGWSEDPYKQKEIAAIGGRRGGVTNRDQGLGIFARTEEKIRKDASYAGTCSWEANKDKKYGVHGMSEEKQLESATKGGYAAYEKEVGIHGRTKEERVRTATMTFVNKVGIHDPERQSEYKAKAKRTRLEKLVKSKLKDFVYVYTVHDIPSTYSKGYLDVTKYKKLYSIRVSQKLSPKDTDKIIRSFPQCPERLSKHTIDVQRLRSGCCKQSQGVTVTLELNEEYLNS